MRIFNWVHRRFNIPKDGSSDEQKLRKDEQLMKNPGDDADTKALLYEDDDDYHAILSIGTFGQLMVHDGRHSELSWGDDDEGEDAIVEGDDDEGEDAIVEADDEGEEADDEENDEDGHHPLLCTRGATLAVEMNRMMINKERTTLAELFSAESEEDHHRQHKSSKTAAAATAAQSPKGLLFVKKKLISPDSRPIQKLHGLMKRMLKRKIHPAADITTPSDPFAKLTKSASPSHAHLDAATHQELWT